MRYDLPQFLLITIWRWTSSGIRSRCSIERNRQGTKTGNTISVKGQSEGNVQVRRLKAEPALWCELEGLSGAIGRRLSPADKADLRDNQQGWPHHWRSIRSGASPSVMSKSTRAQPKIDRAAKVAILRVDPARDPAGSIRLAYGLTSL